MKIVLLGPPGAGKGTLANMLKEKIENILHISTGDILREEIKNGTELGKDAQRYIDNGELVPDEVVTKIIDSKFANDPAVNEGFMLDGFPRTKKQAEDLDVILKKHGHDLDCALYMDSSLPIIIMRLTGRRVCKSCGAIFHMTNKPPQKEGVCDVCGQEALYQRADDNEETIKKRMDVYLENTNPILDFYKGQNKLVTVNGDDDTDLVRDYLFEALNVA